MEIRPDFSWAELGERIRARRAGSGMTQQSLAAAAGLTQNAIFRIEAGETNPQLLTLQSLAKALGTTVRELLSGVSETDPRVDGRFTLVQRIVESGDEAAIRAMDGGLENARELLERSTVRREMPSPNILVAKGEGRRRRNPGDDLMWLPKIQHPRSETDDNPFAETAQKVQKTFRDTRASNETQTKDK